MCYAYTSEYKRILDFTFGAAYAQDLSQCSTVMVINTKDV
jgi:hypothetical protein